MDELNNQENEHLNEQQLDESTKENEAYTWENPDPYTPYEPKYEVYRGAEYTKPKKEKKPRKKITGSQKALIAVSSAAAVLFVAVCVLSAYLLSTERTKYKPSVTPDAQTGSTTETEKNKTENKERTVPDISVNEPTSDALSIPKIYAKVIDSVVGIEVETSDNMQSASGSGTGIIISEDGYISTNAHVVEQARQIKVVLNDGSTCEAELIGSDSKTDIAVIKIEKAGLTAAEFGNSDSLIPGESVVAIGNPYGMELQGTITSGIVSAVNRQMVIENVYMTLIQTDAAINPGNSGGPLVNMYGQVVGITSSKIVNTSFEGIGFAIPVSGATDVIEELIQFGYVKDRPSIGIYGRNLDETYATFYQMPNGVYVEYVDPESDAYKKGLLKGDIITGVDGKDITTMAELDTEKSKHKPGETITLKVYRKNKYIDITVKLSEATN